MESGIERRRAPRIPYRGKAVAFVGNDRHDCRIIDLSKVGALIGPPIELKVGVYLRLNIALPQLDELIDVDGVVARETAYEGTYACGVAFMNVSQRAGILLDAFIKRALQWQSESEEIAQDALAAARAGPTQDGDRGAAARIPAQRQAATARKEEKEQEERPGTDPLDRFIEEVDLRQIYREALGRPGNSTRKK